MKNLILLMLLIITQVSYSQWEACNNGLYGANIQTIANSGSNIFVGTSGGGIFTYK